MAVTRLKLLVVEDERALARLWAEELAGQAEATLAHSVADARAAVSAAKRPFDVILLDLRLPDGNGLDFFEFLLDRGEDHPPVIILTGNADVDSAVRALRLGAFDYLTKPCKIGDIERLLDRVRQRASAGGPARPASPAVSPAGKQLVGDSPALAEVRRLIARVAPSDASVLVQGETGTGKDVVASTLHAASRRGAGPFVPVNCAALPKDLAESELFGHVKGAFTGADRDHPGLVQTAAGGTLFLDEIGDLPLDLQAKLLRLLENNEARRVGDTRPYRTDIRVVAATHKDLRAAADSGRFRADLYYRLSTFQIRLPSLRDIPADLPGIARHLLSTIPLGPHASRSLSGEALARLASHPWPGNVRELRNVLERAALLSDSDEIGPDAIDLSHHPAPIPATPPGGAATIAEMELAMIRQALAAHGGNKTAAARALGISLRTLYNKLELLAKTAPPEPHP